MSDPNNFFFHIQIQIKKNYQKDKEISIEVTTIGIDKILEFYMVEGAFMRIDE